MDIGHLVEEKLFFMYYAAINNKNTYFLVSDKREFENFKTIFVKFGLF